MARPNETGQVRIIAGVWRSRKITFLADPDVRPTPDRVRETLFSWLQPVIAGTRCLDLFAGSGVLGLEALSRGGVECLSIDQSPKVIATLLQQAARLSATGLTAVAADVLHFLQTKRQVYPYSFDLAFVDPPYQSDLLRPTLQLLHAHNWLKPGAAVYFEAKNALQEQDLPNGWQLLRSKHTKQVYYHLAQTHCN